MSVIYGTSLRDNIVGTDEADYIIAGAGPDFYVLGGAGADVFEVNYGDEILRVADFELGVDQIALESREVLDGANFSVRAQNPNDLDIRLSDNTLIRLSNVAEADVAQVFVFRSEVDFSLQFALPVPETRAAVAAPVLGYNIIEGTEGRDNIIGTYGADYIIAGAGSDFYVLGGDGADVFEVNYGDEIIRIADFELGVDLISLADETVLAEARVSTHGAQGQNLDVRLSDNTLIRVNNVTADDLDNLFTFRALAEEETPPEEGAEEVVEFNVIEGTDGRDDITGTSGRDYIIAAAGKDFQVCGGAGADVFEVNYGDEVIRIADFVLGEDCISLASRAVLDAATFKAHGANGQNLDVRLSDGTLIRINGVEEANVGEMFVFRDEQEEAHGEAPEDDGDAGDPAEGAEPSPPASAPEGVDAPEVGTLKIVVFGGQSLNFGATGRDWVSTEAQFDNSLMLAFEDPYYSAQGWTTGDVDTDSFLGLTPRFEVAQEAPATGAMNVLAAALPDVDFVSLHYGKSGESLDFIAENTSAALYQQLELLKAWADAEGRTIDTTIELAWTQGQSGADGDYSELLSAHLDDVQAEVDRIFGEEFDVNLYASITRGFGGKVVTADQFAAIQEDEDIFLGATEVVFNAQYPAGSSAINAHLTGEGYYMMGAQIGSHILANMSGDPVDPIAVEAVTRVAEGTYHIDFSGVVGSLQVDEGVYADDDFIGVPDHFGIDIYKSNGGRLTSDILSSRIVDDDTIEIVYSEDLSGTFLLWVGRSESDGWMADGSGAGYGGTTLFDDAQSYAAVDPIDGLSLRQNELFEFIPQQAFEFLV